MNIQILRVKLIYNPSVQRINLCEDYTVKPLQSVILTKTGYLRSLEEIVKHAEAFESAFWYQAHLNQQTDSAF